MPDPILRLFAYAHLPAHLQQVSRPIGDLASLMYRTLPPGPERDAGLRKLLEAKDCLVRAALPINDISLQEAGKDLRRAYEDHLTVWNVQTLTGGDIEMLVVRCGNDAARSIPGIWRGFPVEVVPCARPQLPPHELPGGPDA